MTKYFDKFFNLIKETLKFYDIKTLDVEPFIDYIPPDKLKNAIYIDDWDLSLNDRKEITQTLSNADKQGRYIVAQAYPYNSRYNAYKKGIRGEFVDKKFKKDRDRLLQLYNKFGFRHIGDGFIYRKPRELNSEMTDAGVFGADGEYPTDDPRVPFVMGTYSRQGKVKTKKSRKRKKRK